MNHFLRKFYRTTLRKGYSVPYGTVHGLNITNWTVDFSDFSRRNMHNHSTRIYGPHWFIFLFAHDHSTNMYRPHSFILSFVYDHSTKIRVLIDLFLLFVHNHSTKLYGPVSFVLSSFCTPPFDQKLGYPLI